MSTDEHMVSMSLHNAARNNTNIVFTDKLHTDTGSRVGAFEVIDELSQILNGVDIMMRGWRNEAHPWG